MQVPGDLLSTCKLVVWPSRETSGGHHNQQTGLYLCHRSGAARFNISGCLPMIASLLTATLRRCQWSNSMPYLGIRPLDVEASGTLDHIFEMHQTTFEWPS